MTHYSPQEIVDLKQELKLPAFILAKWHDRNGLDPVASALECFASHKRLIVTGGICAFVTVALVGVGLWAGQHVDWAAARTYTPNMYAGLAMASFCFALGSGAGTFFAFGERDSAARRFTSEEGGFGYDYAHLLFLLGHTPASLGIVGQKLGLEEAVTEALVDKAFVVQESQKTDAEDNSGRRKEFGREFDLAKRFALAHQGGWTYYFQIAAQRIS